MGSLKTDCSKTESKIKCKIGKIKEKNTEKSLKPKSIDSNYEDIGKKFLRIKFELDLVSIFLFLVSLLTRMYKLEQPRNIV